MRKEIINLIKKNGLKVTKARLDILKFLSQCKTPVSVSVLYNQVRGRYDLATIYRTTTTFVEKRIIFVERVGRADCFYVSKTEHHHIVCRSCHIAVCLPCDHTMTTIKNFRKISHQFVLRGLCNACSAS